MSAGNIIAGFKRGGMWPVNQNAIPSHKFYAAELADKGQMQAYKCCLNVLFTFVFPFQFHECAKSIRTNRTAYGFSLSFSAAKRQTPTSTLNLAGPAGGRDDNDFDDDDILQEEEDEENEGGL